MLFRSLTHLGPRRALRLEHERSVQSKAWCGVCCQVYREAQRAMHDQTAGHLEAKKKMADLRELSTSMWKKRKEHGAPSPSSPYKQQWHSEARQKRLTERCNDNYRRSMQLIASKTSLLTK